jgi:hypothetical protein
MFAIVDGARSVDEQVKPIEQHGVTTADFTPDTIVSLTERIEAGATALIY